jgi:hypothetical protein
LSFLNDLKPLIVIRVRFTHAQPHWQQGTPPFFYMHESLVLKENVSTPFKRQKNVFRLNGT